MKIYNRCVIDIKTGTILEEDAFEHDGPIAQCFGNDSESTQTSYVQSPEQRQMFQLIMPIMALLSRSAMSNRPQNPMQYNPQNQFYPQQGQGQGQGQGQQMSPQQGGQGINPFQWWAQSQLLRGGKK